MARTTLRVSGRLTVAEAADLAGTTRRTIEKRIAAGTLNAERSGRRILFVRDDAAFRHYLQKRCA